MTFPSHLPSTHSFVVYCEHDEIEETDVVSMGVEPERNESFVYHCTFYKHCAYLGHHCRPYVVFVVGLGQQKTHEGEKKWDESCFHGGFGQGVLAGGGMEVEFSQGNSTAQKDKVAQIVVFVEFMRVGGELRVIVLFLHKFIYEQKGRNRSHQKK